MESGITWLELLILFQLRGGWRFDHELINQKLHRTSTNVLSAVFDRSIHLDVVACFRGGREPHITVPLNRRFHTRPAKTLDHAAGTRLRFESVIGDLRVHVVAHHAA